MLSFRHHASPCDVAGVLGHDLGQKLLPDRRGRSVRPDQQVARFCTTAVEMRVVAHFDGGRTEPCDLLVGADGPASSVRQQLLPEVVAEYAGYVAWRGVVPEAEHPELSREFEGRFTFFQAPRTHILCYLIPGLGGGVTPGQ